MRTDRRGPLAAFVVVAVIAAILLVTSVRSQAEPGWLRAPAATVADVPSVADVWSGTIHVDRRDVQQGVLVAHRTVPDLPLAARSPVVRPASVTLGAAPRDPAVPKTSTRVPEGRSSLPAPGHGGHQLADRGPTHGRAWGHTHGHAHVLRSHGDHRGRHGAGHGRHLHHGWNRSVLTRG